jgi:hypothetical protein
MASLYSQLQEYLSECQQELIQLNDSYDTSQDLDVLKQWYFMKGKVRAIESIIENFDI